MKPKVAGVKRIINAAHYSSLGFSFAWKNEAAFRQELILCCVLVPGAFWLGQTSMERIALISCCALVVIVELLNTAIEAVVDRIGPERHELAGSAKDLGSAAVAVSLLLTLVVWALVAYSRFFS